MALELNDGKITGSSGVAKAGLTLGIIGTALAALNNGNGLLGGWFGNGTAERASMQVQAAMQSQIDQLQAEKYADGRYLDLYTKLVTATENTDSKIAALGSGLAMAVAEIDKQTALTEQAARLNREYDNATRDYMFTIVNNKIDCCCEKASMQASFDRQISELTDASILSYVNSNFLPRSFKTTSSKHQPQCTISLIGRYI